MVRRWPVVMVSALVLMAGLVFLSRRQAVPELPFLKGIPLRSRLIAQFPRHGIDFRREIRVYLWATPFHDGAAIADEFFARRRSWKRTQESHMLRFTRGGEEVSFGRSIVAGTPGFREITQVAIIVDRPITFSDRVFDWLDR
jgi:hypothetical protein